MKNQRRFVMTAITIIAVFCSEYSFAQLANWKTDGNAGCGACIFGTSDLADLDFYTNNTQWMTLSTSGNVGIGTSVPGFKLQIVGGTDVELATGGFLVLGSTSGANISFDDNEIEARSAGLASTLFLQNDDGDLNVSAGGLYVQADNDVGIGTTSPLGRLHVAGEGLGLRFDDGQTIRDGSGALAISIHGEWLPDVTLTHDLGTSTLAWDDCNADNFINISDRKEKQDIRPMTYGLNEVMKMKPVNYTMLKKPYEGNQIGFIAQDMEQVIPEVVKTTDWREDENGSMKEVKLDIWGIEYGKLIPVVVSAIQQQQTLIEAKDQQLKDMQSQINQLQNLLVEKGILSAEEIGANDRSSSSVYLSNARLEQNAPNPFSIKTTIKFFVPESSSKATITITDANGKVMKMVDVSQRGESQIVINAFELTAGNYNYSLIIDGKIIDNKQMVLTR